MRGESVVEVAHEALITRWDRLKALINENRRFLLWRQRLILRMDEWNETKRDKGALLQGAPLDEAKRWRRERGKELNEAEQEYIAVSEKLFAPGRALKVWAAAAAVVAVLALAAFFGWRAWVRSDTYQINAVLSEAPTLVSQSDDSTADEWYFALAATGRKDEMLAIEKGEKTPRYLKALIRAGRLLSIAGKKEEANSLLSQAFTTVNEGHMTGKDHETAYALIDLSKALLEAGRNGEAEVAANKAAALVPKILPGPFMRSYDFFTGLVEVGKRAEALEAARAVPYAEYRNSTYLAITEGLIKVGDAGAAEESLDQMLESARQMPTDIDKAEALAFVAQKLSILNKSDKATGIAEEARGIFIQDAEQAASIDSFRIASDDC